MKTIDSQKIVILGAILAATMAAGCFGGPGYSNQPYGYNGGYSYPQNNGNAYNAGYQNGERADASRDNHQDRDTNQHVVVIRDHDQPRTEKQPSNTDHGDDYSKKDSQSAHPSVTN